MCIAHRAVSAAGPVHPLDNGGRVSQRERREGTEGVNEHSSMGGVKIEQTRMHLLMTSMPGKVYMVDENHILLLPR